MKEKTSRSLIKGIVWRIISIILLAIITYIFTKNLIVVTLLTIITNLIFLAYFYIHERIWLRFERPKSLIKRSIAKMFTYVTVCTFAVFIPTTFLLTNNNEQTFYITLVYTPLKHVMYIFNEVLWRPK